jgi:hypothetical protein
MGAAKYPKSKRIDVELDKIFSDQNEIQNSNITFHFKCIDIIFIAQNEKRYRLS